VAHRSQLAAVGLTRYAIAHRIAAGSLHPVLRSVVAVGHPALEPLALETAAVLQVGRDAVLSHASAAGLWGIARPREGCVEITIAGRNVRVPPGLRLHRVPALDSRDVRIRDGLPVTAPARALIDLAADADEATVRRALTEARVLGLVGDRELEAAIERCPLRSGTALIRALLHDERGPALTRSQAERLLCDLIDSGQLPRPRFNVLVHGHLVDAVWDDARLVVEVDGYGPHGHRPAFERDRRRDQTLAAHGHVVLRVTWRQLTREPMPVLARLARALAIGLATPRRPPAV
jgi:very-short-patch-repair endonuclease